MGKNTAPLIVSIVLLTQCSLLIAEVVKIKINHHLFTLNIPKTSKQYIQGLMFRHHLPERTGMLFAIDPKDSHHFDMWMKNTYIPLDMLFIGPDYRITCIKKNAKPLSLKHISCPSPTIAVIEINGGEANKYHLVKGMKIMKDQTND